MKVFVTGASGFIGAHVMKVLLDRGHKVAALIMPGDHAGRLQFIRHSFDALEGTIEDTQMLASFFKSFKPEACIHLAWYTEPGFYLNSERNLQSLNASLGLFQTLFKTGCPHIVAAGTCFEYDTDIGSLQEETPVRPASMYAAAKLSCFLLGSELAKQSGIRFAWGRIFYPYGPMENLRRLVPAAISALLQGQEFPASPGEQIRDYIHVADVAMAFCMLMEKEADGIFNICSGVPITIAQLLETIGKLMCQPDLVQLGSLPYRKWEPQFICGDNARLKQLGWEPTFGFVQGLSDTIRSFQHTNSIF